MAALLGEAAPTLPTALTRADSLLARAADAAQAGRQHAQDGKKARAALANATRALADAEAALAQWETEWTATLTALTRPDGERPSVTGAVLDHLGRLAGYLDDGESLTRRIDDMQAVVDAFQTKAHAVAARLDEPAQEDAFEAVTRLGMRRQRAARRRVRPSRRRRA